MCLFSCEQVTYGHANECERVSVQCSHTEIYVALVQPSFYVATTTPSSPHSLLQSAGYIRTLKNQTRSIRIIYVNVNVLRAPAYQLLVSPATTSQWQGNRGSVQVFVRGGRPTARARPGMQSTSAKHVVRADDQTAEFAWSGSRLNDNSN